MAVGKKDSMLLLHNLCWDIMVVEILEAVRRKGNSGEGEKAMESSKSICIFLVVVTSTLLSFVKYK